MRPLEYLEILFDHALLRDALVRAPDSLFLGMTSGEIEAYKIELTNELALDASFKLLTKIEADIRQDFIDTIRNGWTDPLSMQYGRLFGRNQKRNSDPERIGIGPITDELQRHFLKIGDPFHSRCGDLLVYFQFRNWYAHGRFLIRMPNVPVPAQVQSVGQDIYSKVVSRIH